MSGKFDREAQKLEAVFPRGPRVVVLGSSDFWHGESERTCTLIGQQLAGIPDLVLITGGVEGIGEAVGRGFFQARCESGKETRVFHVLPEGEPLWDYGETFFAGSDMGERREVLGRLSQLYLTVEGGPRTAHEVEVASLRNAIVIPVGRSGGYSSELYSRVKRPPAVDEAAWAALGSDGSTPELTAVAVRRAVRSILESQALLVGNRLEPLE